jgi:hypothetical protein
MNIIGYNKINFSDKSLLSQLEVESPDAVGKHEGEEECEANQNSSNWPHEIRIVPVMVLYIVFNTRVRMNTRHTDGGLDITIL